MTRDYKNVSEAKAKSKESTKSKLKSTKNAAKPIKTTGGISIGFVLLAGVVIGAFVSFLVYLSVGVDVDDAAEKKPKTTSASQSEPQRPDAQKAEPTEEKSRFEFYSILPERKVEVSVEDLAPESAPRSVSPTTILKTLTVPAATGTRDSPAVTQPPANRRLYVLQVGSFTQFKDADKRKANLAFMGVASKIHAISKTNRTMYRVQVGPFGNIKKVNEIAALLKKNKIPSLLMKVKG